MSGFIGELVEEFTHQGGGSQQRPPQQQGYGGYSGGGGGPSPNGPPLPPGWMARWDQYRNCYIYINQETGEETLERPYYRGGPPQQGYGQGGYEREYGGGYGQGGYEQEPRRQEGGHHGMAYGAAGAAAGLVGGAMLMHEGDKVGKLRKNLHAQHPHLCSLKPSLIGATKYFG